MIEFIGLLVLIIIVVTALRQPRTHAEAQYATDMRRKNRKTLFFFVLAGALVFCIVTFIGAIAP